MLRCVRSVQSLNCIQVEIESTRPAAPTHPSRRRSDRPRGGRLLVPPSGRTARRGSTPGGTSLSAHSHIPAVKTQNTDDAVRSSCASEKLCHPKTARPDLIEGFPISKLLTVLEVKMKQCFGCNSNGGVANLRRTQETSGSSSSCTHPTPSVAKFPKRCTHPHDGAAALAAPGREVRFVVALAEELPLFLDEADADQRHLAVRVRAHKVVRAPLLIQGSHKRASVNEEQGSNTQQRPRWGTHWIQPTSSHREATVRVASSSTNRARNPVNVCETN